VLLSDRDLIDELKNGRLQLEPFEPELVQPSSIDVRLDRLFRVLEQSFIAVIKRAKEEKIPHRIAAMAIGVEKVMRARIDRGLFP